jgi:hypothetical protein
VPKSHVEDGVTIGSWVGVQRATKDKLPVERRALLEYLPGWSWDAHTDQWNSTYDLLRKYTDEHGTSRVPFDRSYKGVKLGNWVYTQRRSSATGKLSAERQRRLEKLRGWEWSAT